MMWGKCDPTSKLRTMRKGDNTPFSDINSDTEFIREQPNSRSRYDRRAATHGGYRKAALLIGKAA